MGVVKFLLVAVHVLTAVGLLLTALAGVRSTDRVPPGMFHCALTMLVTGVLLVFVDYAGDDPVNNARVAVKTVVLVGILALVVANRSRERPSPALFPAVAGLTLFNATLAFVW